MLKVIQVKIQEHTSCKKKNLESTWFIWSKDRFDRSKYVSAEIKFDLTAIQAQKGLGFQIYFS